MSSIQEPEASAEPGSPQSPIEATTTPAAAATTTAVPAATATVHEPKTNTPELDVPKLQSLPAEQQELYLLTFVSSLTKHVLALSSDDCTAQQFYLKREIFQIINLPAPQPSRVIRNNLGKCLAHIFSKGDRKLLFETINDLVGIVSGGKAKSDGETRSKHAAVSCLGDVFAAAGDSAIGLHQLSCATLVKTLKSSSNNAGMRAAVLTALAKIVVMIEGSMDETVCRDIWKQCRSHAASDKGALVVAAACRCLRAFCKHTPYFRNSADFDKLESAVFKAVDSSSSQVRHAAADCFAEAMVQGYAGSAGAENSATKSKKSKAKLKRVSTHPGIVEDDDDLPSRSASPAPGGKRTQDLSLTIPDMLKLLSTQYVKSSASNKARTAIGVCYGKLFRHLGENLVQANYLRIVESFAVDILGHSNVNNNRHRLLLSRKIIDTIVQDVIGRKILGESGQVKVAELLINNILKNYPQPWPRDLSPRRTHLLCH